MQSPGWVYALINPSLPRYVKVGMTTRDPEERVKELSSATGVVTPFVLVFKEHFADCVEAERHVHALLEQRGVRVAANREFFEGEVADIIKAIMAVPGRAAPGVAPREDDDLLSGLKGDDLDEFTLGGEIEVSPEQALYDEAEAHYYGFGGTIQDYPEAMRLYRQAAKLGLADAYHMLGRMHADGDLGREDNVKAVEFFKEAARRGAYCAYGRLAEIFHQARHAENERKAWSRFFAGFSKEHQKDCQSDFPVSLVCTFLRSRVSAGGMFSGPKMDLDASEMDYVDVIRSVRDEAMDRVEKDIVLYSKRVGANVPVVKQLRAVSTWLRTI